MNDDYAGGEVMGGGVSGGWGFVNNSPNTPKPLQPPNPQTGFE